MVDGRENRAGTGGNSNSVARPTAASRFDTARAPPLRCRATIRPLRRRAARRFPDAIRARRHPPVTERQFRDALAQFATGVTIITAPRAAAEFVGFTANSFNSVSLDPPLIVWSLARRSRSLAAFESAERYAVNVLAHDQVDLARRFSRPHADRFAGVAFRLGAAGAPLIEGCVAWLECRHHALHPAGDHMLFIGEVEACAYRHVAAAGLARRPISSRPRLAGRGYALLRGRDRRARYSAALLAWNSAYIFRNTGPGLPPRERLAVERGHGEHFLGRRRQPHLVGAERLVLASPDAARTAGPPSRASSNVAS